MAHLRFRLVFYIFLTSFLGYPENTPLIGTPVVPVICVVVFISARVQLLQPQSSHL